LSGVTDNGQRFRLLVVGVGGQGVLTAARFVGEAALAAGMQVNLGQLHGMSQRGGSVSSTVVLGPGKSSFIATGRADLVLAFEPLEALRARIAMSGRTQVVVNTGAIVPWTLAQAGQDYPSLEGILDGIRAVAASVHTVDGDALARESGAARSLNIAMLGVLTGCEGFPLDGDAIWQAVAEKSSARFVESNRRAFELGRGARSK
jgi:indolepyruvate ferredoxin oxidoreductase beta subunit